MRGYINLQISNNNRYQYSYLYEKYARLIIGIVLMMWL